MRYSAILVLLASLAGSLASCTKGPKPLSRKAERGRFVFLKASDPQCGKCHRLNEAGTVGFVGPDLDKLRPTRDKIIRSVTNGVGLMPHQVGVLSTGEIEDVADYVIEAAGRPPH